jgi:hypothetical protein
MNQRRFIRCLLDGEYRPRDSDGLESSLSGLAQSDPHRGIGDGCQTCYIGSVVKTSCNA